MNTERVDSWLAAMNWWESIKEHEKIYWSNMFFDGKNPKEFTDKEIVRIHHKYLKNKT